MPARCRLFAERRSATITGDVSADGAGSVSQGGEGAMLAVNEAMAYMSQKVQGGGIGA